MVAHAFATSTSRMALRETFFNVDLDPSVATSLIQLISLELKTRITGVQGSPHCRDAVLARCEN